MADVDAPRVLIVDDEVSIREYLSASLGLEGFSVETAGSAEEALDFLGRGQFTLMLADIRMPGRTGLELIEAARGCQDELACIMISGLDDLDTANRALELGAYDYVTKPFNKKEIQICVSSALERRRSVIAARVKEVQLAEDREQLLEQHTNVQLLLNQLAELYRVEDHAEAYEKAFSILDQYLPLVHYRAVEYRAGGSHEVVIEGSSDIAEQLPPLAVEEFEFVLEKRSASLIPAEPDEVAVPGVEGRLLIPLIGRQTAIGVLVLYVGLAESSERHVLEVAEHVGQAVSSTLEKVRLMRNIRVQSDLVDNILESIPHGLIAIGLDDKIITFNRNAELMFGIQRFFAIKEAYHKVLPARVLDVFKSMILMTLRDEGTVNYELDHEIDERTPMTLGLTTSTIYNRQGQPEGVLFICRDLSLSREVEKLRELDQMKSEFVHTVSHELKTPLTAILGGSEILLSIPESLDEEQLELVEIVEEGARRLRTLINDLLDLSKLESGGVAMNERENSLTEVADETIDLLKKRGTCTVKRAYEPDLKQILFDRDKMKQVFENLISNAIKYSPAGGVVEVKIHANDDNCLQVDIKDQGIGIAPEEIDKVFDKFYRVNASTTAEIEGTGLGLSITQHVIEMHGGEIWVESDLGQGSQFSFKLPIRQGIDLYGI